MDKKLRIGVIGASRPSDEIYRLAEEVGQYIAIKGAVLVSGGLTGVMEAACRGAKSKGGVTVGIIPGDDANDANPYVDFPIVTGLGVARNSIVVRTSDVIIAVGGGPGTLSEIGFALNFGKPLVGLKTWKVIKEGQQEEKIPAAKDSRQAVEMAMELR